MSIDEYVYSVTDVVADALTAEARAELCCVVWQTSDDYDSGTIQNVIAAAIRKAESDARAASYAAAIADAVRVCRERAKYLRTFGPHEYQAAFTEAEHLEDEIASLTAAPTPDERGGHGAGDAREGAKND